MQRQLGDGVETGDERRAVVLATQPKWFTKDCASCSANLPRLASVNRPLRGAAYPVAQDSGRWASDGAGRAVG